MSLRPPTVPTWYLPLPIPPAEVQTARASVERSGRRLALSMNVLMVLTLLGTALSCAFWLWCAQQWSNLQRQIAAWLDDSTVQGLTLPTWTVPSLLGLTLLGGLIAVWACWVAGRGLHSIREYTLTPSADTADAVQDAAKRIRPWILLGQLTPLISVGVGLIVVLALFRFMGNNFSTAEWVSMIMMTVIQAVPQIILNWLILAAIRRWLDAVVIRTQRPFPVRPFAQTVQGWFIFVLICLGLLAISLAGSGLTFLALGPSLPELWPTLATDLEMPFSDTILTWMSRLFTGLGVFSLISLLIYVFLMVLIAWSRQFALQVATVLDAGLPQNPPATPSTGNPWDGPEVKMP